jgi:hypothetical protein
MKQLGRLLLYLLLVSLVVVGTAWQHDWQRIGWIIGGSVGAMGALLGLLLSGPRQRRQTY